MTSFVCLIALHPITQSLPDMGGDAKRQKLTSLSFLLGSWKGTGWSEFGGRRSTFNASEKVESKAGGTVIAITGFHTVDIPGRAEPFVVHDAYAMLTWEKDSFSMTAHLSTGASKSYAMNVVKNGIHWSAEFPGLGIVTYEMNLTEDGRWLEKGFTVGADESRKQVFEMDLKKQ